VSGGSPRMSAQDVGGRTERRQEGARDRRENRHSARKSGIRHSALGSRLRQRQQPFTTEDTKDTEEESGNREQSTTRSFVQQKNSEPALSLPKMTNIRGTGGIGANVYFGDGFRGWYGFAGVVRSDDRRT
jgi:hypothetical protein